MPFTGEQRLSTYCRLGSWRIEEALDELQAAFAAREVLPEGFHGLKSGERKRQWLAARLLVSHMTGLPPGHLRRDHWGRPLLPQVQCSISHADGMAVALVAPHRCGIDIERPQARIHRLAHKFLHAEELAFLPVGRTDAWQLTLAWSAKEAMYKFYGRRGLSLRLHYRLAPWNSDAPLPGHGYLDAQILPKNEACLPLRLRYWLADGLIWTVACPET
jgi:4'-phosphopantetheinyl transferase EntD